MLNVCCDDLSPELLGHRRVILIHVSQKTGKTYLGMLKTELILEKIL